MPHSKSPFLAQLSALLRAKHYSLRTEEAYVGWIKRFILFHDKQHPETLGERQVESFLTVAVDQEVSASTQNQALNALAFLYKQVLRREDLGDFGKFVRTKRPRYVPVVLSRAECKALLAEMDGTRGLMAALLYGTGMRLMEVLRLRVKDVDFGRREITVRQGKGAKDRRTMLPASLCDPLSAHISRLRELFEDDRARGLPGVALPLAFERKAPRAGSEWAWQWVFPTQSPSTDPRSGVRRRHHLHEDGLLARPEVVECSFGSLHEHQHSSQWLLGLRRVEAKLTQEWAALDVRQGPGPHPQDQPTGRHRLKSTWHCALLVGPAQVPDRARRAVVADDLLSADIGEPGQQALGHFGVWNVYHHDGGY